MTRPILHIEILFFAVAHDLAGTSSSTLELAGPATVRDAEAALKERFDWFGTRLSSYRIAVDEEFASADTPLSDGSTIAIIPPVSGG